MNKATAPARNHTFVTAANVAAQLHHANIIANQISLTASNARALALRAGHRAAGFRSLTEFIDELARKTDAAAQRINRQAMAMSRTASETERAKNALIRFEQAYKKGEGHSYLSSVDQAKLATQERYTQLGLRFINQVEDLKTMLVELGKELRTANVLSAMSRVEAATSGKEFETSLNVIAENVAQSAQKIQDHVRQSQQLVNSIRQSEATVVH